MKSLVQQAIDDIKGRGFTHIKVELEAELRRDDDTTCRDCDDDREVECSSCEGEGAVQSFEIVGRNEHENWVECEDCSGEGYHTCETCENGLSSDFEDESDCGRFILDNVSVEAREALTFGKFYNDGSVDSEYTFTLPIEHAPKVIEYIKAFRQLGESVGNGIDVAGAGMHIALLTQGAYGHTGVPPITTNTGMSRAQLTHYKEQVQRLLPALFLLGSAGHSSRELSYRNPQVSSDSKYSALYTMGDRVLEFRLFETCYDTPSTFLEYLQVLGNTMRYFDTANTVPRLNKQFYFSDDDSTCARFYKTADQLRILNHAIKYIAPRGVSYKRLKAKRGVHYTIKALEGESRAKEKELRLDYKRLVENHKRTMQRPITPNEQRQVDEAMLYRNMTPESALRWVRSVSDPISFDQFKQRNQRTFSRNLTTVTV